MKKLARPFCFYLKQNIGVPAVPLVRPGDRVERGEQIAARPPAGLAVPLHSSVTGIVRRVTGTQIDVEDTGTDFSAYRRLDGRTPWELVEAAGLVGLGGAGFPTAEKLKAPLSGGTVLINAAECEPILGHNIARVEADADAVWDALRIVMELTGAGKGIVAIKRRHARAVAALRAADAAGRYGIAELDDMYPMGEERAVVREALHILLPPDALPSRAGAVVINVETALRVREAVLWKKPLIDKDMTVAGKLRKNASIHILRDVPVGMKVADVFEAAGGLGKEYGELVMGGPFTGKRTGLDEAVRKTTGGLIAAESFLRGPEKLGLLVCACGADEARLREIARSMGSGVCAVAYCKQARRQGTAYKCENPGRCPGQVQKVLELRRQGAQALLVGNCTDCTNTVMACAPQLNLPVYHSTDQALRAVNHPLIRRSRSHKIRKG